MSQWKWLDKWPSSSRTLSRLFWYRQCLTGLQCHSKPLWWLGTTIEKRRVSLRKPCQWFNLNLIDITSWKVRCSNAIGTSFSLKTFYTSLHLTLWLLTELSLHIHNHENNGCNSISSCLYSSNFRSTLKHSPRYFCRSSHINAIYHFLLKRLSSSVCACTLFWYQCLTKHAF